MAENKGVLDAPEKDALSTEGHVPEKDALGIEGHTIQGRYQVERHLGRGSYANVYIVRDRQEHGTRKAMKIIDIENEVCDEGDEQTLVTEHQLLKDLHHPHIVSLCDSFIISKNFYLITEFCQDQDLDKHFQRVQKENKKIEEDQVTDWIRQILEAVDYIHSKDIIHRDIKPRNLLLDKGTIKLGDFGVSRNLSSTMLADTIVGTSSYMSPEVLKHGGYNNKFDIWSVGCVIYEMVTFKRAFDGSSLMSILFQIVEGKLPEWPTGYSSHLHDVFTRALTMEHTERPSAAELLLFLDHPDLDLEGGIERYIDERVEPDTFDVQEVYIESIVEQINVEDITLNPGGSRYNEEDITESSNDSCDYFHTRDLDLVYIGADRSGSDSADDAEVSRTVPEAQHPSEKPRGYREAQHYTEVLYEAEGHAFSKSASEKPMEFREAQGVILSKSSQIKRASEKPRGFREAHLQLGGGAASSKRSKDLSHTVNCIVRQKSEDTECVYVDCCVKSRVSQLLEELKLQGYTRGPMLSRDIRVTNREQITVTSKGHVRLNLDSEGKEEFQFVFDCDSDRNGQEGWLCACGQGPGAARSTGFVVFSVSRPGPDGEHQVETLCSLPVTIDSKPDLIKPEILQTTSSAAPPVVGEEFTDSASPELFWNPVLAIARALKGDEWIGLARELHYGTINIGHFRQQSDNGSTDAIVTMLMDWNRRTRKMSDQATRLIAALESAGYNDVANEIIQHESSAKTDKNFRQAVQLLVEDANLLREHDMFLRMLGLSDADIVDIEFSQKMPGLKGLLRKGLMLWRARRGLEEASIPKLVECLEELNHKRLAEKISKYC